MIRSHHLHTLSFSWLVLSPRGRILDSGDGTLFKAPAGARSDASLAFLLSAPAGWSRCPAGYAVYCREIPDLIGYRLAFYGLKVAGISTHTGKSSSLSIRLKPEEMEKYVNEMMGTFNHIDDNVTFLVNRGVHDFRHINSDIKNAAEDLRFLLEGQAFDSYSADRQIGKIKALAEIVSAKLDFLDYFSNPTLSIEKRMRIVAFRKFDKAKRVLARRAFERDIRISLVGSGSAHIMCPQVFDVVPYILIENAVKYSPEGEEVKVFYNEHGSEINVSVTNLGPALEDGEEESVFLPGYRGRAAMASRIKGNGIGIYFAKLVIERYLDGSIEFSQKRADMTELRGTKFCATQIKLRLPMA